MFLSARLSSSLRAAVLLLGSAGVLTGCASGPGPEGSGARYRVIWTAEHASDHAPLAASSALVRMGGTVSVKTGEKDPTEERPAITAFSVYLKPGSKPGVVEAISRAFVRQVIKTPKGKLKRQKRVIGALIPMHPGDRQLTSSTSDPIAVTLQLERAPQ